MCVNVDAVELLYSSAAQPALTGLSSRPRQCDTPCVSSVVLVQITGERSDCVKYQLGVASGDYALDGAHSMVLDQLICSHPTEPLDDVRDVVVTPPAADNTSTKVDYFLDTMDLTYATRTVHAHTISHDRKY